MKHETNYNFLFMEYLNLTENINSIKEENKIDTWKYEEIYKKKKTARSKPLMSPLKI